MGNPSIEVWHTSDLVEKRVRSWFATPSRFGIPDGERSIVLPHPEKRGLALKIKGAGHLGGPVRFGTFLKSGPTMPRYDFEGRFMVDHASGHDAAFVGGASFQQAATEYRIAQMFGQLDIPVVACLGYGKLEADGLHTWFSVHEVPLGFKRIAEDASAQHLQTNIEIGQLMLRLAQEHGLIGYFWFGSDPASNHLAYDLHPFVHLDPVNASQLTWVMQLAFAIYVRCQACKFYPAASGISDVPPGVAAYALRALLPDAIHQDYLDLRDKIIKPFKKMPPTEFNPAALQRALNSTRIGEILLEACPDRYVRL
jgi:hypothetical protein